MPVGLEESVFYFRMLLALCIFSFCVYANKRIIYVFGRLVYSFFLGAFFLFSVAQVLQIYDFKFGLAFSSLKLFFR